MQQLLRFEQNRSETKATIVSEMHSCAQIRRMSSLRLHIYVKYVESCMHMRERESKNLNKIAISKCFFFFFFFFFLNISLSWCHDNASLAKPRRSLILHVTRALISFEPIFFFFLKKEKEDLILLIRLMKREMRTVKISRLEESIIIEHDWTRKISIFVYLSLEFL